jgi:hypothetical protein
MDKMTPQQLDLSFEARPAQPVQQSVSHVEPSIATPSVSASSIAFEVSAKSAVIINFKSAVSRREESIRTDLYRQILDSVRHIG